MTLPDQPNQPNPWVEQHDVFISYAREDNKTSPYMVSAFVDRLEADFRAFSPAVPLDVFFDKKSILDGQYWQDKLRKGLRQSKVMIAFLSEAYFHSEWCRKEWEEYVLVEQGRTYPGEALTPIFIVAPPDLAKRIPASAKDWWDDITSRNAVVEIVEYWPRGVQALREVVVEKRLRTLEDNIRRRVELGRTLAAVPRNPLLGERNPNFVGRRAELTQLREHLERHEMVGLCAVNGVGGIGKSSVAREYAYFFRPEYLGAQFLVDLSTATKFADIERALVSLARDHLGAEIPYQLPEVDQYSRAVGAFHALTAHRKALVILDNLNESAVGLVSVNTRKLLPSAEKVHYLITTRADPRDLGGIGTVSLDVLPVGEALEVLFRYRAFARRVDDPEYLAARAGTYASREGEDWSGDAEWKAALAIVNRLGRHSLAVALVGAYLGSYPDLTYTRFAEELARHGIGLALDAVGNDAKVRALIEHPVPLIGALFEQSVSRLSPLALRTLEYAAVLPPDLVPIAWLKDLVSGDADIADELQPKPFVSPPWDETLRTLDGLDYLKGTPYRRMHRVVQEVVLRRMSAEDEAKRRQAVITWIERRTANTYSGMAEYSDIREIDAALSFTRAEAKHGAHLVGRTALWLVDMEMNLGRLGVAIELARLAETILRNVLADDPHSAEKKRDLSISFNKLGDVSVASGDLSGARRYFEEGLTISRQLAQDDPHSAQKNRDLSISFACFGDVSVASGDLAGARRYFEEYHALCRQLAQDEPHSAQKKRDLSISFGKLGDVSVAGGDLSGARRYFEDGLTISRQLAQDDPDSAEYKRDLSISFNKLGDVSVARGDLSGARHYFEDGLAIRRQLAQDDPHSAQKKRDLSISFNKLGDVSVARGDLSGARRYFEDGLTIRRQLAQDDPHSAEKKRDLSYSLTVIAQLLMRQERWAEALPLAEESLEVDEQLASMDPTNVTWQNDVAESRQLVAAIRAKLDL